MLYCVSILYPFPFKISESNPFAPSLQWMIKFDAVSLKTPLPNFPGQSPSNVASKRLLHPENAPSHIISILEGIWIDCKEPHW